MGKQKDQESSDEGMEIEEEQAKRKPKRVKKIIKLAKKEEKVKPMTIEDIIGKSTTQKKVVKKKIKEQEMLDKKIKLFHQIKKSVGDVNTKRMSKGQKKRLERKQRILFKKKFQNSIQERPKGFSVGQLKNQIDKMDEEGPIVKKHKPQTLVEKAKTQSQEAERMKQIINYSQFQKNPLGSIKAHLLNDLKRKK